MDYWRRAAGGSKLEKVRNVTIRGIMGVQCSIVDDIKTKQLGWFGHVQRMPDNRLPKEILRWTPYGRRRRGFCTQYRFQIKRFEKKKQKNAHKTIIRPIYDNTFLFLKRARDYILSYGKK